MQGKLFLSQFLEAKASRARGHSGHEAPPMTHSLVLTPSHEKEPVTLAVSETTVGEIKPRSNF